MSKQQQTKPTLEETCVAALTSQRIASSEMYDLINEVEAAIEVAKSTAEAEKAKALDPLLAPDPAVALQSSQLAEMTYARLQNMLPRLKEHLQRVLDDEYHARWSADFHRAENERAQAAEKFARVPALLNELIEIFTTAAAADKLINAVNISAPAGEHRRLLDTELHARGLQSFSRDQPSLMQQLRLFDWEHSAKQTWPVVQPMDVSYFQAQGYDRRYSPEWWMDGEAQQQKKRDEAVRLAAEEEIAKKEFWRPRA